MNEQLAKDNEGVNVIRERVKISLKNKGVYFIKYPNNYRKNEYFIWSIYSQKDCRAIDFRFQDPLIGRLQVLVVKQQNDYINNFAKKLEEILTSAKRVEEEYKEEDKHIDKLCKEISENTIFKMPWTKLRFNEVYEMVAKQNQLEQDANKAYKELNIILKAEGLQILEDSPD